MLTYAIRALFRLYTLLFRHARRSSFFILVLLALAACVVAGLWRKTPTTPLPPLEVSFWYWRQPFRLSAAEGASLKALGVRRLFVRAGTLRRDGVGARLVLPQIWNSGAVGLDVHLVFNFDYDIVRSYGLLSNDALARAVRLAAQRQVEQAERAGIKVAGIQLDFDCPTRRLARYAELLRRLRADPPAPRLALSITALPTWFTDDSVQAVLDAVDFSVPQYYEAETPTSLDRFVTISHLRLLERGLDAAGRREAPFYVGLPAYGHALLFDEKGRFAGLYSALDPRDALRHPAFRLARAFPADASGQPATHSAYIGEDILDFVAFKPAPDGRGQGYHLLYDLPTQALLAQSLAVVRAHRPSNCRGVILFRFPEPGETLAVPLPALAAALRGETAQPSLRTRVQAENALRASGPNRRAQRAPRELRVSVTNVGAASARIGPNAVSITLFFDRPGFEEVAPRDFDAQPATFSATAFAAPGAARERAGLPASLLRADTLHFTRSSLAAGETAVIGPIRIPADGATTVRGVWSVIGPGGFETARGEIAPTPLARERSQGR